MNLLLLYLLRKRKNKKINKQWRFHIDDSPEGSLVQEFEKYFSAKEFDEIKLHLSDDFFVMGEPVLARLSVSLFLSSGLIAHLEDLYFCIGSMDNKLRCIDTISPTRCAEERGNGHRRAFEKWSSDEVRLLNETSSALFDEIWNFCMRREYDPYPTEKEQPSNNLRNAFRQISEVFLESEVQFWVVNFLSSLFERHPHGIIFRLNSNSSPHSFGQNIREQIDIYDTIEKVLTSSLPASLKT